jgi:hypothetical protein
MRVSCHAGRVGSVPTEVRDALATGSAGMRARRRERRRLAELDRRGALRAEAVLLRGLLMRAGDLVRDGWVQRCWFIACDDRGHQVRIEAQNLYELAGKQVIDVCLVGAVVQAGGGVAHARTQPVRRALDLTWAALYHEPMRWCPSPAVRLSHVRDLTRWNDLPGRTAAEVSGLLALAADRAEG